MKKLESINSLKFEKFKENRLVNLSQIFGGNIPSSGGGCTDSYDWTPRSVNGVTYNDMDNLVWSCPTANDSIKQ